MLTPYDLSAFKDEKCIVSGKTCSWDAYDFIAKRSSSTRVPHERGRFSVYNVQTTPDDCPTKNEKN